MKFNEYEIEKFSKREESVWYRKLRERVIRRRLVIVHSYLLIALPMAGFFQDRAGYGTPHLFFTLLFFAIVALLIVAYFQLRISIRLIADAPHEYLDERQIKLRNNSYLVSYRILSAIVGPGSAILIILAEVGVKLSEHRGFTSGLFVSVLMILAILPSMILAWREVEI